MGKSDSGISAPAVLLFYRQIDDGLENSTVPVTISNRQCFSSNIMKIPRLKDTASVLIVETVFSHPHSAVYR